jgi:hypothetical protein
MEGFQSHHKIFIPKNFKNKTSREVKSDTEESVRILLDHYHTLFNRHAEVYYSVLNSIPRYKMQYHMGEVPIWTEIKKSNKKNG